MTKCITCVIVASATSIAAAQSARFVPLGDLAGGATESFATSVSQDGRTVVGVGHVEPFFSTAGFRWTADEGMTRLDMAQAHGVDALGGSISGGSLSAPVLWTQSGGASPLTLPGGAALGLSTDMSADGTRIVGYVAYPDIVSTLHPRAFVWDETIGIRELGELVGDFRTIAWGISADGQVVVGHSDDERCSQQAFRWTSRTGMQGLGWLPGADCQSSQAFATDADGSVIVGVSRTASGHEAFRWTEAGGMRSLGTSPGDNRSQALATTDDGDVVVGSSFGPGGERASIWTQADGMRSLQDVLESEHGLMLDGWTLLRANDVSADGGTIVGDARNPAGQLEAWVVTLGVGCAADCNGDGSLDFTDFLCFQNLFADGDAGADCDGDGRLTVFDFLCFQNAFQAGCD